jgi:uncharacterized membrane protein YsdA (DUF1294 family)
MSIVALLCFVLFGSVVGGVVGIVLGFTWYEHKCGLLSDHTDKRAERRDNAHSILLYRPYVAVSVGASAFVLSSVVGGGVGFVLGFIWYEHKCGLLSDHTGKRAAGIRFELDDVFGCDRKARLADS